MQTSSYKSIRRWPVAALLSAAVLVSSCIDRHAAPPLTGPSGLGLSLTLSALPNILDRDGASAATITVRAHESGTPKAGQAVRVGATAGTLWESGAPSDGQIVTNGDGIARLTLTAPNWNEAVTLITVSAVPFGDADFANAAGTSMQIRVVGPDVPAPPVAEFSVEPEAPTGGTVVVFDASASTAGAGGTIVQYTWDFGNGDTATTGNPLYAYDGYPVVLADRLYVVTLSVTDDFGQTTVKQLSVTTTP